MFWDSARDYENNELLMKVIVFWDSAHDYDNNDQFDESDEGNRLPKFYWFILDVEFLKCVDVVISLGHAAIPVSSENSIIALFPVSLVIQC